MNICINVAGGKVGLGHLKRCLSIARELKRLRHDVQFCVENSDYDYLVREGGFAAKRTMDASYDMIIVDRYDVDNGMLAIYKKKCRLLARMDDASPSLFKDRTSDIIINGNAYADEKLYGSISRKSLCLLIGGRFVPMDRKMCESRSKYRVRKNVKRIVLTFGGSDRDYTLRFCKEIASLDLGVDIFVLNGARLERRLGHLGRLNLLPFVNNMHKVLQQSDIVICSASSTFWQATAIGVPCITCQTSDNQLRVFQYIKKVKIGIALSEIGSLEKAIMQLNYNRRKSLSSAARKVVDCKGSQRIAAHLHKLLGA